MINYLYIIIVSSSSSEDDDDDPPKRTLSSENRMESHFSNAREDVKNMTHKLRLRHAFLRG